MAIIALSGPHSRPLVCHCVARLSLFPGPGCLDLTSACGVEWVGPECSPAQTRDSGKAAATSAELFPPSSLANQHSHTLLKQSLGFPIAFICPSSSPSSQGLLFLDPRTGMPSLWLELSQGELPRQVFFLSHPSYGQRQSQLYLFCPTQLNGNLSLQLWLYRSSFASFQLVFQRNCSTCRHIFNVCMRRWAHVLQLCHLDTMFLWFF